VPKGPGTTPQGASGPLPGGPLELSGTEPVTPDQARFREVLGHFVSGVTVITTLDTDGPHGFTCQAFAALSLSPALVAFAPARTSLTWDRIRSTGVFCVNVLKEDQEALGRVFATKGDGKFEGVSWAPGATGCPILAGALAWVECELADVHDAGDHLLAIGRVLDLGVGDGHPLVFYRGGFYRHGVGPFGPEHGRPPWA
jgi:3-hydroxy-9,10-secoandrosta-1,3,5(10)-triene-9,17-dione monooxygenase reductase component